MADPPRDLVPRARALVADTRARVVRRDLAAAAGTLTFFSGIALVPWLLLAVWTTTWSRGALGAEERMLDLRVLVPPDMGARAAYDVLVAAGAQAGLLTAVVLVFPASFYGEGLRRACLVLAPQSEAFTGWRARLAMVALVVPLPALVWALLTVGDRLVPLAPEAGGGGAADLALRVLIGFNVLFVVLSALLVWVFLAVAPDRPRTWVAMVGAMVTGSVLAGFLHGFQLFLSLPVDVGLPFAGLGVVGGVVAVGLWLYVLHMFLLVGWAATQALEHQVAGRTPVGVS